MLPSLRPDTHQPPSETPRSTATIQNRPKPVWMFVIIAMFVNLALISFATVSYAKTTTLYRVGVVPQFAKRKLYAIWQPILSELGHRTGLRFELSKTEDIGGFGRQLNDGMFDIAYSNPLQFFEANARQGYVPVVRDGDRQLFGVIVVPVDSPIRSIEQLSGTRIAFPSPKAFGATLLVQAELATRFHLTYEPVYVNTHSSVYLHTVKNLAGVSAGSGVMGTLRGQGIAIQRGLRILHETRKVPPHPISIHPRVSLEHRNSIQQAILEMAALNNGSSLLARIPIKRAVRAAVADYRILAELGLGQIVTR